MGEGLTDYQAKQIIAALKGIERQLKIANKMNSAHTQTRAKPFLTSQWEAVQQVLLV